MNEQQYFNAIVKKYSKSTARGIHTADELLTIICNVIGYLNGTQRLIAIW